MGWEGGAHMKQGTGPSSKTGLFLPISQEITGKAGSQEEGKASSDSLTLSGEVLCPHPHSFNQRTGKGGHRQKGTKRIPFCVLGPIWASGLKPALTACSSSDYGFRLPLVPQLHNTPQSPGSRLLPFASVPCPDWH